MIESLKIHNFRNFEAITFDFDPQLTVIYWDNGKWKSSILEAILQLTNNQKSKWEFFVKKWENSFFSQCNSSDITFSISYQKDTKKKSFTINNKNISSKKFYESSLKVCYFDPSIMNMFLLWPSQRRNYMNQALSACFPGYQSVLQHYNKILKSRNAVLWAIFEKRAKESELEYWNKAFVDSATEVYRYRYILICFFIENSQLLWKYVSSDIEDVSFQYNTKINFENPSQIIYEYLEKNKERDFILQKTHIGPHLDDFQILINSIPLETYASRGETKSIILWLKILEAQFIEKKTKQKPIFLIDDFSSELDTSHRKLLLKSLKPYQVILTNIDKLNIKKGTQIKL